MSSIEAINNNQTIRDQLLRDLSSKAFSITDMSVKYSISVPDLFLWLKDLEVHINQTLSSSQGNFPQVSDQEWLDLSDDDKDAFVRHLKDSDTFETSSGFSIEDLDRMKSKRDL